MGSEQSLPFSFVSSPGESTDFGTNETCLVGRCLNHTLDVCSQVRYLSIQQLLAYNLFVTLTKTYGSD
jgi:hypothetical protein